MKPRKSKPRIQPSTSRRITKDSRAELFELLVSIRLAAESQPKSVIHQQTLKYIKKIFQSFQIPEQQYQFIKRHVLLELDHQDSK